MTIYYFSYDEEGHTFFDNHYTLIGQTSRIEDCYVFIGDVSKEDIEEDDDDYRELNVIEYMKNEDEKLKKENK